MYISYFGRSHPHTLLQKHSQLYSHDYARRLYSFKNHYQRQIYLSLYPICDDGHEQFRQLLAQPCPCTFGIRTRRNARIAVRCCCSCMESNDGAGKAGVLATHRRQDRLFHFKVEEGAQEQEIRPARARMYCAWQKTEIGKQAPVDRDFHLFSFPVLAVDFASHYFFFPVTFIIL